MKFTSEVRDSGLRHGRGDPTQNLRAVLHHGNLPAEGLGLAAVSGILRRLDARLEVESRSQEGSTFRIMFPGSNRLNYRNRQRSRSPDPQGAGLILVDGR